MRPQPPPVPWPFRCFMTRPNFSSSTQLRSQHLNHSLPPSLPTAPAFPGNRRRWAAWEAGRSSFSSNSLGSGEKGRRQESLPPTDCNTQDALLHYLCGVGRCHLQLRKRKGMRPVRTPLPRVHCLQQRFCFRRGSSSSPLGIRGVRRLRYPASFVGASCCALPVEPPEKSGWSLRSRWSVGGAAAGWVLSKGDWAPLKERAVGGLGRA